MPKLHERLLRGGVSEIVQYFMPEAGVHQMENGMFRTADVQVDRHPVSFLVPGTDLARVVWIDVAKIVPARSCPLGHRVGFATSLAFRLAVNNLHPLRRKGQGRLGRSAWLKQFKVGEKQRKLIFRKRLQRSVFKLYDRDGFTP